MNVSEESINQRNTLNNILERIDHLEGFNRPHREVFINENQKNTNDPWLDNECEPLENEIIGNDDNLSEPLYISRKPLSTESSVGTPSIIPDVPEDRSLPPDIHSDVEDE